MNARQLNFTAGPSKLPEPVLRAVEQNILTFQKSGVGISELGHRTKYFEEIVNSSKELFRKLLGLNDAFDILFMTGGATAQFSAVPLNLIKKDFKAAYIISGHWAKAAMTEAKKFGDVLNIGSTEHLGFSKIPDYQIPNDKLSYVHFTSNNTIYGTQFQDDPDTGVVPLVCDASSDILSRKIDPEKYTIIYAGAQKNLGTPGVTVVIINKNKFDQASNNMPKILDYKTYLDSNSLYNTPPVLPIYMLHETLKYIEAEGGMPEMEKRNTEKASLLYSFLDKSELYEPYVKIENQNSRSKMNVVFTLRDSSKDKELSAYLKENGILGLEGHRSIGGFRASLYNAINLSEVKFLVNALEEFENQ